MKKAIAFTAALLLASCMTGCGSSESVSIENSSKADSSSAAEETEEETEAETEEATEEDTEKELEELEDDIDSGDIEGAISDIEGDIDLDDEDISGYFGTVEVPDYAPQDASESDFVGKWEGSILVSEGEAYDSILGIPISAMFQMELTADGKGVLGSGFGTDEEDSSEITWKYSDNSIIMTADGEDTECTISGGDLVMYDNTDGEESFFYFKKVSDFTVFDWDSFYESMGISDDIDSDSADLG